jgi:hypothetical protein
MTTPTKPAAKACGALLAVALAALVLMSPAQATQPTVFTEFVDQTAFAPATSAACGFPVYITQTGTVKVTLFHDQSGAVVREADWQSGFKVVFSAPTLGTSFQFPVTQRLVTYYDEGTSIGSSARAVLIGLGRDDGDGPPDTGRLEFEAVVVFIGPNGIPGIDFVTLVQQSGRFEGVDVAERCASLAGGA